MLAECFRVLKPLGKIRLSLPMLEFLINMYNNPDTPLHRRYMEWSLRHYAPHMYIDARTIPDCPSAALVLNNFMRMWGHKMLYDCPLLQCVLQAAGFCEITRLHSGASPTPFLCRLEQHGSIIPQWANDIETTTVEAVKPQKHNTNR